MDRVTLSPALSLSRIVYGMWRLGDDPDTSPAHVEAKIEACLAQGITSFDQADIYGGYTAEALFGGALRANPALRDKIEIISKCGIVAPVGRYETASCKHYNTSAAHITQAVEGSIRDMGCGYLDLLLIHRPDPFMDPEETGQALDKLVQSGKVRAVGVSNFRPWDWELLQSAMQTPLATNQIEISLSQPAPFTNGDLAFHQRHGHPIMAWSPLGGGALMQDQGPLGTVMDKLAVEFGVDRAAIAVAFLLAHPAKILPVMGTNNLRRINIISNTLKVSIEREQWFRLYEAALGHEVA